MAVHREIGPGFEESYYHLALRHALQEKGHHVEFKPSCKLVHRGRLADLFEPDLVVDRTIVVEIKAQTGAFDSQHLIQLMCYLKFLRTNLGLLLNFGREKLEQQRVLFEEPQRLEHWDLHRIEGHLSESSRLLLHRLRESIESLFQRYGLGYRQTTYQGLFKAELTAAGVPFEEDSPARIRWGGRALGVSRTRGLAVGGAAFVKVTALQDEFQASEIAAVRAYLRHLGLDWGLYVNFGKKRLEVYGVCSP